MRIIEPNVTVLTKLDTNAGALSSAGSSKDVTSPTSSVTSHPKSGDRVLYGQRSPHHPDLLRNSSFGVTKGMHLSDSAHWPSEAKRLTQHAQANEVFLGKIGLGLMDQTMTLFNVTPHPSTYPKAVASQQGLDAILHFWDPEDIMFDWIEFDGNLRQPLLGATIPTAARIGYAAFNNVIVPTAGVYPNGEKSMQLSEVMSSLQVIVSAAHENTHLRQYDTYQYVDQDQHKKEFEKLPDQLKSRIFNACQDQSSTFEVLGYQSEVINLLRIHEVHQDYFRQSPSDLSQWNELLESSLNHRDIHFDRLTEDKKTLLLQGDIHGLMKKIHDCVPIKYLVNLQKV